ncbi:MAG: MBL fold metallo-hydrolase [Trueperaceae bacterium]|nr:MBL fold metallo-hydrolase [Trueperaceae bacterium]
MSITLRVLGGPEHDNALFVWVHSGQRTYRLLFDCGAGCVRGLEPSDLHALDHLFLSHLHMDHIGGFDDLFRRNFNRPDRPNHVWGPPETARIMQHRFRGFMWNYASQPGEWVVHDVAPTEVRGRRFLLREAFARAHDAGTRDFDGVIVDTKELSVEARLMDHLTPSLAFVVREKPRLNVDKAALQRSGLPAGGWLEHLKDANVSTVRIGDRDYDAAPLRRDLLRSRRGEAVAYLTDFLLDDRAHDTLLPLLDDQTTIVCESQYRHSDSHLARRNHHLTATQAAQLAADAGAAKLVLIHLSDRYRPPEWAAMLAEAREVFAETYFPESWSVG